MPSKIRLSDGREITVTISGKRTAEALEHTIVGGKPFTQFATVAQSKVWVNPLLVSAIEDRPDLDPSV